MEKVTGEEIIKVVENLVGGIKPVGCSTTDTEVQNNIRKLGDVIYMLTVYLESVIKYKNSEYGSMADCGFAAERQLRYVYEILHDDFGDEKEADE